MNASTLPLYTNEVSQDYFRECDQQRYTEEQLASFSEDVRELIQKQQDYLESHPPIAIYRLATEGSRTRDGGVIKSASTGQTIGLDNGQMVRVAQKGDSVVYADGSTAKIVTGAGESNSNVALVGSRLCNGDEIINTPQRRVQMLARKGVPMAEDFLPVLSH